MEKTETNTGQHENSSSGAEMPLQSGAEMPLQNRGMQDTLAQISSLLKGEGDDGTAIGNPQEGPAPDQDLRSRPADDSGQVEQPDGQSEAADEADGGREADHGQPDADQVEPPAGGAERERSLKDLAADLDMDVADLYSVTIPIGSDGATMTLGELKNAHLDRETAVREAAQREQQLDQREAALTIDQQLMAQIGHELEGKLSRATLQQMQKHQEDKAALQRRLMLTAVPEFADDAVFKNWQIEAAEFIGQYGYKPHELQVTDHRVVAMLRDMMRKTKRLDQLLSFDPDKQPSKPPKTRRVQGRARQRKMSEQDIHNAVASGRMSQMDAVTHLIEKG